jgi:4-amino-4-deoxy-L-arabinose transferase-like glycosyltransferase
LILSGRAINVGVNEWSARFVPALFGVIIIPAIYFPTKRLFGSGVGLIAALLMAISPWHIFWSQNARYFTPLMFFYTMALFAIYFGLEQDRPILILVSAFLFYLALSERLSAFS